MTRSRTGGEILADALILQGADTVTCVPGESFLPFLDAAWDRRDRLKVLAFRHEGGAAYAAEAHGKLTGRPGICFVGRGPGASHAAIGVHTAFQDSTPMVLLIGQVDRPNRGREAFQEVDLAAMFRPLAKRVEEVDSAARLPEAVARAFAAALGGRPGPVALILPEDVLAETAETDDVEPLPVALPHPGPCRMDRLADLLGKARRPLAVVGGGGWTAEAGALFTRFAEAWSLPVAAAFRCQDIVDNDSPVYVGELGFSVAPALARRVREADLLLAVGTRLGEIDTNGYTLVRSPNPVQTLIHVFPEAEELGRVYRPALAVVSAMPPFARRAADLTPPAECGWHDWARGLRDEHLANRIPDYCPGALDMGQVMEELEARLPADAIICTGAGNYTGWPQRFHRFHHYRSQLAPTNGSMGYGLPAALAAKAKFPDRTVVAFAGDGCFLMTAQELATARLHGLAPLVIVIDNGMYGTIRMHQEASHPGRALATDLANPDFAALARSYGAWAATVEHTHDFVPALEQALAAETLALLHLRLDPEAITTRTTLTAIREKNRS
ncbi:thiamine pyrophosphate-dependent enzyme [Magnetospirillum sp. SS-4]|uniref:thiamine pyrophosphate-dependent enzyme n=1 Tax=Magnetospirillum sp. SS-4 TaxID=2681465 RepID=UPI0013821A2B|nr:thiamine pyrophosphate-dependent enzyme [Magnetospirillum sp. SS-4]CAA7626107.1 Thiamine pyrophosphate-requiring enzyme [Magnetospirillum sp. SS-4]